MGGRRREYGQSKLAKKAASRPKKPKSSSDKKRRASLFRRISSKIANAEIQQMASGSPITPSRSLQSFSKDSRTGARLSLSPLDPFYHQVALSNQSASNSSQSSPSSSVPNTPTSTSYTTNAPVYQRPSSLHGLKGKLHTLGKSPSNRRKSICLIPLSPLARTPSPSRSPSPLAFCLGHHPAGASNLTQSYSPNASTSSNKVCSSNTKIKKANSFKEPNQTNQQ